MSSPRHPWWQATRTYRQSLVLGFGWLACAFGGWLLAFAQHHVRWDRVALAVVASALAALALHSAVRIRRRERRGPRVPGPRR